MTAALFWTVVVVTIVMRLVKVPAKAAPLVIVAIVIAAGVLSGCGGSELPTHVAGCVTQTPTASNSRTYVCPAAAKRWAQRWCDVKPGFTRARTIALMGAPTHASAAQLSWTGFGYDLTAFLDETAHVRQLDINTIGMTARQRAGLKCPEMREAR